MTRQSGLTDNERLFLQSILMHVFDFAPGKNICPEKYFRGVGAQNHPAKPAIRPICVF
jgi:hypothetical protein